MLAAVGEVAVVEEVAVAEAEGLRTDHERRKLVSAKIVATPGNRDALTAALGRFAVVILDQPEGHVGARHVQDALIATGRAVGPREARVRVDVLPRHARILRQCGEGVAGVEDDVAVDRTRGLYERGVDVRAGWLHGTVDEVAEVAGAGLRRRRARHDFAAIGQRQAAFALGDDDVLVLVELGIVLSALRNARKIRLWGSWLRRLDLHDRNARRTSVDGLCSLVALRARRIRQDQNEREQRTR